MDLICNPLETSAGISKFEVQDVFDHRSIEDIIVRSGGNPLDIKILCAKIFDYFIENQDSNFLQINLHVVQEAMRYYASISEKSKKIKDVLDTCTKDQLEIFKRVYYFEGLSIRSIIWLELAFNPMTTKNEEKIKDRILKDLDSVFEFGLFELSDKSKTISDLFKLSSNALSKEYYWFIGDTFDKLYITYFYEKLTNSRLYHNENRGFDNLLCKKLSKQIAKTIVHDLDYS